MRELIKDILAIIGGLFAVVGSIYAFFKWGKGFLTNLFRPSKVLLDIPKKTIIILPPFNPESNIWTEGNVLDKPAMHVTGRFRATNITKGNVQLITTHLREPKVFGLVTVGGSQGQPIGRVIPSGATMDVVIFFTIAPPMKRKGEPFVCDFALLDQFGNEHWEKKVHFRSAG